MTAFFLSSIAIIGTVLAYGLVAAPWWLKIALGMVIAATCVMCLLAYLSAPPLVAGERVDNK